MTSGAEMSIPPLETLAQRLASDRGAARRLAALDLMTIAKQTPQDDDRANRMLLAHLSRETDPAAAARIARHFGETLWRPARQELWRLYRSHETPVEVAHEAVLAHDRIERADRSG